MQELAFDEVVQVAGGDHRDFCDYPFDTWCLMLDALIDKMI